MKKLDFVVAGVPRSGTTVMQVLLNALPNVVCFSELFEEELDHSTLDVPAALLSMSRSPNVPENKRHAANHWLTVLNGKDLSTLTIGNKMPRYYCCLRRILDELHPTKAILSVRELPDLMKSYNNRAHEGKDWHRGQVGIFAFAEQLNLLKSLHTLLEYDVLIVPNKCL